MCIGLPVKMKMHALISKVLMMMEIETCRSMADLGKPFSDDEASNHISDGEQFVSIPGSTKSK